MAREQHQGPSATTEGRVIHWAGLYDALVGVMWLGRERELRRQTIELAELEPGQQVLDVGCGTGTLALAAAEATGAQGTVVGIDPAAEMIARARRKAAQASVQAQFDVGVIEDLDFLDGTFDVVFSSLMLHHLPEHTLRDGLAEIQRVLKPGGRLVVVDFTGGGHLPHRLLRLLGRRRARALNNVERVSEAVAAAGFRNVATGRLHSRLHFSLVARASSDG